MNLAVWLDRQARAAPERPALFWGKDTVATYGQFAGSCGRTLIGCAQMPFYQGIGLQYL